MSVRLLTEHYLRFLSLKGVLSLHLSKCHIVGNHISWLINGLRSEKTCLRGFANNTGADQPAHPRSLINASVIRFLERIICKLLQLKFQFSS